MMIARRGTDIFQVPVERRQSVPQAGTPQRPITFSIQTGNVAR